MSKTKYLTVRGKAYWAKVFPENKDFGYEDELKDTGGQYVVQMRLDEDSVEALTKAESQTVDYPREMEYEGETFTTYKIKRLHEKRSRSGELLDWASGPVKVVKPDGTEWVVSDDGFIGNGSELSIDVCVYKAGRTVGTRMEKITVVDPVEAPVNL